MNPFIPAILTLALPLSAQVSAPSLPERFKENRPSWEESLEKGNSAPVRKATESLLQTDGVAVNPSDYNGMHAMVAVMNLAARACVLEGAWEEAVSHLQKAAQAATDNETTATATFAKIVKQHQEKLTEWREETRKQEQRLKSLEAQNGLTFEQIKLKSQIHSFLDEYRNAIAQSERSLGEIDGLLALLKKEREVYTASMTEWQGFIAKEKADIARTGSAAAYVAEKLDQIKADDARPRTERLAYGRRLQHLDPNNPDVARFVNSLTGKDDPVPKPTRKGRKASA